MSGSVATATRVQVDVQGSCYTKGHAPETMSVSENQAASEAILIWVASASTWGHGTLQTQAWGHIWVYGPAVTWI